MGGREVTANPAYEKALLGAVLFDNRVMEEYKITSGFFTEQINVEIWREIDRARLRGAQADILEISLMLPDKVAYIANLTDCVTHGNTKVYYDELKELVKRRGFVTVLDMLSAMIRDGRDSQDMIEYVERTLTEISADDETGYKHVSACIGGLIEDLQEAARRKGALSGIDTGFPLLNAKNNGWQNQALTIVGARPGAGKTSIALNMTSAALRSGKAVGFFSAEMDAKSIVKRMVADWSKVRYSQLNSGLYASGDMNKIQESCEEIAGSNLFINDRPAIRISDLVSEARRMQRRDNVSVIFIDYLSLVKNDRRDLPRHEQVAEISKTLKQLARELNIPVIVLSQLTREAQGERPKLSQLRDSGAVEEDADMVILLWNQGWVDETSGRLKITLIVEKNRNGPVGDIDMDFEPDLMRFRENINKS